MYILWYNVYTVYSIHVYTQSTKICGFLISWGIRYPQVRPTVITQMRFQNGISRYHFFDIKPIETWYFYQTRLLHQKKNMEFTNQKTRAIDQRSGINIPYINNAFSCIIQTSNGFQDRDISHWFLDWFVLPALRCLQTLENPTVA